MTNTRHQRLIDPSAHVQSLLECQASAFQGANYYASHIGLLDAPTKQKIGVQICRCLRQAIAYGVAARAWM